MDIGGWIVSNEGAVRFSVFAGVFAIFAIMESWRPALPRLSARVARWTGNLGLGLVSSVALRIILPGAAVLAAVYMQMRGWGIFNTIDWPVWLEIALSVVLLDFALYGQHVVMHRVPMLWRLHQVHHADREVDVSTALRFHPLEIVMSQLYKVAVVASLGADPLAVVLFEVLLNACAMFNHANLQLTRSAEHAVRAILVTPAMHRIHHSERPVETNTNYGNTLSLWDRMCGTYSRAAEPPLTIGLETYRTPAVSDFLWLIALPFRNRA